MFFEIQKKLQLLQEDIGGGDLKIFRKYMEMLRPSIPRLSPKKIRKISILEKSTKKLNFPLHHLIEKFNIFFNCVRLW